VRDVSLRVMNMVRRTLVENPEVSNEALYAAAVALDPSVAKLTLRQFHARYPLQVRRWELGGTSLRHRRPVYPPGSDRVAVPDAPQRAARAPAAPAPAADGREPVEMHKPSTPWPIEVWPETATVRPAPERPRRKPAPAEPALALESTGRVAAGPAATAGKRVTHRRGTEASRDGVRSALLRFAAEIAAADTAAEMIDALRRIDDHVGQVLTRAGA